MVYVSGMFRGISPDLLSQTMLFRGLPKDIMPEMADRATQHALKTSSFFFQQGEPAKRIFVLLEGKVRVTQSSVDGNQVFIRLISKGELFGVIAGFGEDLYPATAQSEGKALAASWTGKDLSELMVRHPIIAINTIKILSQRIQEMQNRVRELSTERVERRIARALLRLVAQAGQKQADGILIDLKLSRQDLAEMTGTTLFTVSRILNQWEEAAVVKISRQKIKITHPHGLVKIAEDLP